MLSTTNERVTSFFIQTKERKKTKEKQGPKHISTFASHILFFSAVKLLKINNNGHFPSPIHPKLIKKQQANGPNA